MRSGPMASRTMPPAARPIVTPRDCVRNIRPRARTAAAKAIPRNGAFRPRSAAKATNGQKQIANSAAVPLR